MSKRAASSAAGGGKKSKGVQIDPRVRISVAHLHRFLQVQM